MIWRFWGFMYGDGYAYKNTANGSWIIGFEQSWKNKHLAEFYKKILEKVTRKIQLREKKEKILVYTYNKRLSQFLITLKKNPTLILKNLQPSQKREFILGFFDADGSITTKEIVFYDYNKELLLEISEFLKKVGIKGKVKKNKNIWRLRIREKNSRIKFFKFFLQRSWGQIP